MSAPPKFLFLKPRSPGMSIRDPQSRQKLPDEGGRMPNTSYWQRRIRDKDVIVVDEPAPEPIKSTAKAATKPAKD